jgi:hypothetical protein
MTEPNDPGRLTDGRAVEGWALDVLGADDDLRVHTDAPGFVEVALRCAPECCPTGGDPGPGWTWLDRRLDTFDPIGYRSAPCPVCLRDGGNWVTTGPIELTGDDDHDAARLRKRLEDLQVQRRDDAR